MKCNFKSVPIIDSSVNLQRKHLIPGSEFGKLGCLTLHACMLYISVIQVGTFIFSSLTFYTRADNVIAIFFCAISVKTRYIFTKLYWTDGSSSR